MRVCVYVRRKGFELYTFASALIRVLFSFFFHLFLQFENIITVYFFLLQHAAAAVVVFIRLYFVSVCVICRACLVTIHTKMYFVYSLKMCLFILSDTQYA